MVVGSGVSKIVTRASARHKNRFEGFARGMSFLGSSLVFKQASSPSISYSLFNKHGSYVCSTIFSPSLAHKRFLNELVVKLPKIAESVSEGTLTEWVKDENSYVEKDDPVALITTDKIVTNVNAPESGVILKHLVELEQTIEVGSDLFILDLDGTPSAKGEASINKDNGTEPKPDSSSSTVSTSKEQAAPKSPDPPVLKETSPKVQEKSPPKDIEKPSSPQLFSRNVRTVPLTKIRLRIAERLKDAQNQAAFLTTFNEVDMSNIIDLRAKYGKKFLEKHGVKLGFMGLFSKACAVALMRNPQVNASMNNKEMRYHDYADISVAVATDKGLITPVIRNCESRSVFEIENEILIMAQKAKENKLSIADLTGGTFTISNGGVFGSLMGTPILNPPQAAILGMHATKKRPVEVDERVEIRPMMYIALTYDHKVMDGKEAVTFLVDVKNIIEDPVRMILDL